MRLGVRAGRVSQFYCSSATLAESCLAYYSYTELTAVADAADCIILTPVVGGGLFSEVSHHCKA